MDCIHCGSPVVLVPSAQERARRHGGSPRDYTALFREHVACALQKRELDTRNLMRVIIQRERNDNRTLHP